MWSIGERRLDRFNSPYQSNSPFSIPLMAQCHYYPTIYNRNYGLQ